MQLATNVPTEEYEEYAALSDAQREFVEEALVAIRIVAAGRTIGQGARQAEHVCRWGAKRIQDLYRDYRKARGNWRVLVPGWHGGHPERPPAFGDFWRELCERNQRKCRPAYVALMARLARWRAGDHTAAIPGYPTPPRNQKGKDHPKGWSYSHLMRIAPKRHELTAARIGRSAAAGKYGPKVLTTRVGLKVGQYYMFDDVWHDLSVNVVGQSRSVRPIEVGCIDLLTGYRPQWLCKPILIDGETGRKKVLAEVETLFVTASVLHHQGYRTDTGTTLTMEGGTATLRGPLQSALEEITGGKVMVEVGGTQGAPAIAGDYGGRAKGNPRFKAALESFHNLLHNRLAALPGATGKDRDHLPERDYRLQLRNNHLLRALVNLADAGHLDAVRDLRLDLLEYHQFIGILGAVYNQIHTDTQHDLQGWQEAGHILTEFRLSQDQPYAALTDLDHEQAALVTAFARGREGLTRARKMSRQEAWHHHQSQGGLRKLSLAGVGALLRAGVSTPRRVNEEGCFRIKDKTYAPEPIEFLARATGSLAAGHEIPLERRREYETAWNPLQPDILHVWDANGRWLGVCPGRTRARRDDDERIRMAMGEQQRLEADMLAGVNFRGRHIGEQRKANTAANLNLLDPQAKDRLARAEESAQIARSDRRRVNKITEAEADAYFADVSGPAPEAADHDDDIESPF